MGSLGRAIEATIGRGDLRTAIIASGLPGISFYTHRAYLPHLGQLAFLAAVAERCEGTLALKLAKHLCIDEYGAFGRYIHCGRTLGAALTRTVAAVPWHMSHDRASLSRRGDVVRLKLDTQVRNAPGYRHYAPMAAGVLRTVASPYVAKGAAARLIRIDAPRQGALSAWEQLFGCEVRFDCDILSIDFDVEALYSQRRGRPSQHITIEDVARESSRQAPRDLVGTATELIRLAVLDGEVRLDAIAEQLRLGPRTFRRNLAAEGVSFRHLVSQLRAERAAELLTDGSHTVQEVALLLGYSDAAHFVRAIKRDTGRTPGTLLSRT